MKSLVLFSAFTMLYALTSKAQTVPTPEFANVPYFWNKKDTVLMKPKKETSGFRSKIGEAYYSFEGAKSEFRITAAQAASIILQFTIPSDPAGIINISKFKERKKTRETPMAISKGMSVKTTFDNAVEYNVRKVQADIIEIVPSAPFTAGEYVIMVGAVAYTFGVD